ncbi:hypothetical protein T08_15883, partial [Trichinella sp. T8]
LCDFQFIFSKFVKSFTKEILVTVIKLYDHHTALNDENKADALQYIHEHCIPETDKLLQEACFYRKKLLREYEQVMT